MSFDISKVNELYPGVNDMMLPSMLIWKLPAGKEGMMSEVCNNGDYFAEEKIDGAWYQFTKGAEGQEYLFGRTISRVTGLMTEKGQNVPHILSALDCLPNRTALIGEIYFPGGTAKDTVTIMGCLPAEAVKRQLSGRGQIHYYIHDIIFYDGVSLMNVGAWNRYRILSAIWEKYNLNQYDFLRKAEALESGIEDEVSRILNNGGEGMVLKKRDAIYYPGKRPAWTAIKFKQMDDTDLVCTRTIPATREYTGKELETWLYWENKTKQGQRVLYSNNGTPIGIEEWTSEITWDRSHYGEAGWEPITKPYALGWHTAIGIGAYDDNGNLVELGTVSSGLTDEDRAAMGEDPKTFVGKVVSLHCMSRDKNSKTLRHPVFKMWRDDKNAKDCKISEIFK